MILGPAAVVVGAYLFGSLSFAIILVRVFRGEDVRARGSGNAGATNVLRTSGKALAIATLALDVAKGTLAVLAMRLVTEDGWWVGAAALAAVLGHVFPVYFGFRGGKGVATALGALLPLSPGSILLVFVLFAAIVGATRYVSLGSVAAATAAPFAMRFGFHETGEAVVTAAAIALLLVFTHRANLARLARGNEHRLGRKEQQS